MTKDAICHPDMLRYFEGLEKPIQVGGVEKKPLSLDLALEKVRKEGHVFFADEAMPSPSYEQARAFLEGSGKDSTVYEQKSIALEFSGSSEEVFQIYERYALATIDELLHELQIPREGPYEVLAFLSAFEEFCHAKFLGQKRFSIEGSEGALLILHVLKKLFFQEKISMTVGMSHRGRIAATASVFEKPIENIFKYFLNKEERQESHEMGDVLYHRGFAMFDAASGCSCELLSNPSHLESVYPVVLGVTRREQDLHGNERHAAVVFHGDASLTGQGVVYETLEMQRLDGYKVFGTLHVIIDNQVGFTAAPQECRSTKRPTDIFIAFSNPILHVNEQSPIDLLKAALIAYKIRQTTGEDVVIRVLSVRKWGHNESDDPAITQPKLYKKIRGTYTPSYIAMKNTLMLSDVICENIHSKITSSLNEAFSKAQLLSTEKISQKPTISAAQTMCDTQNALENLKEMYQTPNSFSIHSKVLQFLEKRRRLLENEGIEAHIDWAFGEALAIMLLVQKGYLVRLTGQDVERGTFTHRHAVLIDQETEKKEIPLKKFGKFEITNSPLSEYAALGFEYGYSLQRKQEALPLWEAQFGDFVNGAQIVIDQYISSGFEKWGNRSNLVLLLPHGYEGQGPEHSSCRLERFLGLAHDRNMTIACPSVPETLVKLLQQQVLPDGFRPLILLTPKAMLRDPKATSSIKNCLTGDLQPIRVLNEPTTYEQVQAIFLTTGKLGLELLENCNKDTSLILSLEILFPFPAKELQTFCKRCQKEVELIWMQEEPLNMGAAAFILKRISEDRELSQRNMRQIGRKESASPATGHHMMHDDEKAFLFAAITPTAQQAEASSQQVLH